MECYQNALRHTFNGVGRASRRAFWLFLFQAWIVLIPFVVIDELLGQTQWLPRLYLLAMLPVFLSVTTRRLHDTGRSSTWLLLLMVPVFGWLYLLLMMVEPGDSAINDYGDAP